MSVGNTDYEFIIVVKSHKDHGGGFYHAGDSSNNQANGLRYSSGYGVYNYWWNNDLNNPGVITLNELQLVNFSYDTDSGRMIYVDGELGVEDTASNLSLIHI